MAVQEDPLVSWLLKYFLPYIFLALESAQILAGTPSGIDQTPDFVTVFEVLILSEGLYHKGGKPVSTTSPRGLVTWTQLVYDPYHTY